MSKWIQKDLFASYVQEKEKEEAPQQFTKRSDKVWPTPEMGTADKAKVYEGRFIPDPKGKFTKKYMYHGFKAGEKFRSFICEKTYGLDNFCAFCTATQKLYMGNENDKKAAANYKRKSRNVGNWYVVDDPRDAERDADKKLKGSTRIYEFPDKVDSKLKSEITDKKNGLGPAIFDPGDEGYNFLLKAKATKKDANNKVWPDYADSSFARKPYALGNDKEIKAIMESAYDLDEYIATMKISDEDLQTLLKTEMLWELVEADWKKYKGGPSKGTAVSTEPDDVPFDIAEPTADQEKRMERMGVEVPKSTDDMSDEDLLKELEEM